MPIIPQFRAEGPAQPVAPGMESPAGLRVNATTALRGIATLADSLGNVTQDMPNAPADLGQGSARGMQAIGEGIGNVGEVMFDIRKRLAEAWNYRKVSEAQDAMYGEVANFEKWKLTEPNPTKWETEWNGRMERMKNDLVSGEDLSPAAKEQIGTRVMSFGTRHGFQVGVEAAKKVVDLANESNSAEIMRAMQAGDIVTVKSLTQYAVDQGWKGADWAEQTNWRASESIRKDAIDSARMQSDTYAMRGMFAEGRQLIADAPWETEEQKQYELARYDKDVTSREVQFDVINRARDGEDVGVLIEELTAKNADGTYKKHDGVLSPIMRAEALQPLYQLQNETYATKVDLAEQYIEQGEIKTAEQLEDFFDGKAIDPLNRTILLSKMDQTFKLTEAAKVDVISKVAQYKPEDDVSGAQATSLELLIRQTFGMTGKAKNFVEQLPVDPQYEKAMTMLEKRKQGQPLTLPEGIFANEKKAIEEQMHAAADYRVDAGKLAKREVGGKTLYIDFNQKPEPNDPARFENTVKTFFGLGEYQEVGRIIEVDQQDREALEAGKAKKVTDLAKKRIVNEDVAKAVGELERQANTGEVTQDNLGAKTEAIILPSRVTAAEKAVTNAFSPPSTLSEGFDSSLFTEDLYQQADALLKLADELNKKKQ